MTKQQTSITKDISNKKITVIRGFNAPLERVWEAWTEQSLLDQWWAPKPWKAITKSMDFREGGFWLYSMNGPNGEQSWDRVDFRHIEPKSSFTAENNFCDESGNLTSELSSMHWRNQFEKTASGTKVVVEIIFAEPGDLEKILSMGFQEGFTAALGNLDELL